MTEASRVAERRTTDATTGNRRAWSAHPLALVAMVVVVAGAPAMVGLPVIGLVAGLQVVVLWTLRPDLLVRTVRAVTATVPALVGWAVIVVAVDWGAGALWNAATEDTDVPASTIDLIDADLPPPEDPRVDSPAYAGADWVERYFSEFDALRYDYVPFIGPRVRPVAGRYINSSNGIRRSYEPAVPSGQEAIEVWFFGGSTTWGEGQRDLHTVPSEVARLAEADGFFLRMVNNGERGYTSYQEFLLLQQRLVEGDRPDLVVFYDGHNELGTRQQVDGEPDDQPTVFQLDTTSEAFRRAPTLPVDAEPREPSLRQQYAETSVLHKILRRVGALAAARPALAQPAQEEFPPLSPDEIEQVFAVYGRSVELARELAAREGFAVEHFWQPFPRDGGQLDISTLLPSGVHDIQDAYVGGPPDDALLIDGGHTNEQGARIGAEAVWNDLRPTVERLVGSR